MDADEAARFLGWPCPSREEIAGAPTETERERLATQRKLVCWRVYRMARLGQLPSVKIGHRVFFNEADLLEIIANGGRRHEEAN